MPSPTFRSAASNGSSSTSYNCSKPTGTAVGDLLFAFHNGSTFANTVDLTLSGSAGWSLVTSDTGSTPCKIWGRVADGSESSTFTFGHTSGAASLAIIVAVQNAAPVLPLFATSFTTNTVNATTPTLVPNGADDLEIRWVFANGQSAAATWTSPATYTERADLQSSNVTAASLATKQLSSGAATGSQTFVCSQLPSVTRGFTLAVGAGGVVQFSGWGTSI